MDTEKLRVTVKNALSNEKSIRLIVLLGICGILLVYLSNAFGSDKADKAVISKQDTSATSFDYEQRLERSLARIVTAITGEEAPAVLVTLESGSKTIYAENEKSSLQNERTEQESSHVILKGTDGGQQALTVTELQPSVKGVVIVSGYAADPVVREKLTMAVKTALDISSARVCVTDTG